MKRLMLLLIIMISLLRTGPSQADTPLPITPENAARLVQVGMLGRGWASDLAWLPDGKTLVVASSVGVWLYDMTDDHAEPHLLPGGNARSVAVAVATMRLAVGMDNGLIVLWDINTWTVLSILSTSYYDTVDVAFHPDGIRLAAAHFPEGVVQLWDTESEEIIHSWHTGHLTTSIAFSPDGAVLASGSSAMKSDKGWIFFWDVEIGETLGEIEEQIGPVGQVAFSPDGTRLVFSEAYGSTIWVWEVPNYQPAGSFEQPVQGNSSLVFSPDGTLLASGGPDGMVRLRDIGTGENRMALKHTLPDQTASTLLLAFSPDGNTLVSVDGATSSLYAWDITTGENVFLIDGHALQINQLVFSPDGTFLTAGGWGGAIYLWNTTTFADLMIWYLPGLQTHLAYNPDGDVLASSTKNYWADSPFGVIQLWDTETGKAWQPQLDKPYIVEQMAFSPDGQTLALVAHFKETHMVLLVDMTAQEKTKIYEVGWRTRAVLFTAKGMLVVTSNDDKTIRVWNLETGQTVYQLDDNLSWMTTVVLHANRQMLAIANQMGEIRLLDLTTGDYQVVLDNGGVLISRLAFSPDGQLLADGGYDPVVRVWDVNTGEVLAELPHNGEISGIAFSPDRTLLATASDDSTVRLWGVPGE